MHLLIRHPLVSLRCLLWHLFLLIDNKTRLKIWSHNFQVLVFRWRTQWPSFIFADVWSGPRYLEYPGVGLTSVVYVTWPCPRRAWFLSEWSQGSNPAPYTAFQKKKKLSDCLSSLSYGYSKASYIRQTSQLFETACLSVILVERKYKATSIYFHVVVVFHYLTYFTLWILIAWI